MREQEERAAERLVALLLRRHNLHPFLQVTMVEVQKNWKTKFRFTLKSSQHPPGSRYGRRPGLELEWEKRKGDVDAWSPAGGFVALWGHVGQMVREGLGFEAERPSRLLRIALEQEDKCRGSNAKA